METGDESLMKALERLWPDLARRKMYVTGGGQSRPQRAVQPQLRAGQADDPQRRSPRGGRPALRPAQRHRLQRDVRPDRQPDVELADALRQARGPLRRPHGANALQLDPLGHRRFAARAGPTRIRSLARARSRTASATTPTSDSIPGERHICCPTNLHAHRRLLARLSLHHGRSGISGSTTTAPTGWDRSPPGGGSVRLPCSQPTTRGTAGSGLEHREPRRSATVCPCGCAFPVGPTARLLQSTAKLADVGRGTTELRRTEQTWKTGDVDRIEPAHARSR